jgi:signal transduction histidine kinase
MGRAVTTTSSDGASDVGTMVIMVLLAALVPAGCVLWFLDAAMENQQLAVRQRLTDAYRSQFDARRDGLLSAWKKIEQKLKQARKANDPGQIYKLLVSARVCSAIIVYDESGQVLYPRQLAVMHVDPSAHSDLWDKARQLEDDLKNTASAEVYADIARKSDNIHLAARAMQGQIRCLVRTGQADRIAEAIDVITGPLSEPKYRDALDSGGRLIVPAARLLALQLGGDKLPPELSSRLVRRLVDRLWDDDDAIMSSSQRLFLIDQLRAIKPQAGSLKSDSDAAMRAYLLYWAQVHAARFLEVDRPKVTGSLLPSGAAGLWATASTDNRIVVLFTDSRVESIIQEVCDSLPVIRGAGVAVRHNAPRAADAGAFLSEPLGDAMPVWRVSLFLEDPDPFQAAADRQRLVYLITAGVAIGLIVILSGGIARYLRRQMKLTRIKNDLIATVSHELKTPLASMRVLIDTLVAGRLTNQAQADEYLQLIARENLRLSRLIDNFLTFSRMERNKCAFKFEKIQVVDLITEAIESTGERFTGKDRCLRITIAPDLPAISGDSDALVTVILNLLDNAWKYSGDDREIRMKVSRGGRYVRIKVSDNGIGMSPRTVRRIFGRFYQADRTLTSSGGCGLGLSIVKFILDAHGATIDVASRPNAGSTFTVKLPAQPNSGADK